MRSGDNVTDLASWRRRKQATPEQVQKVRASRLALKEERESRDFQQRLERIKQSIGRINQLMSELRDMKEGE
jgi:Asp-tRNA(Asn)/Glu-tRNA(Gln) amidotransferase C subunit